jgi:eukaryotic-like serine/threonine-protein kinase
VARAGSLSSFLERPASDPAPANLIGRRLGPYDVLDRLGAGGMGEVYRARDTRLGREVAIKTLPHDHFADESRRRRFSNEARAASALNHPNIVTIHEIESIDGIDLIVMELVSGKTLNEVIRPRLKLADILRLAIPIADALARAHAAGIVHRDLKPANIMVTSDGLVKILDFGLAKLVDLESEIPGADAATAPPSAPISVVGAVVGTPAYMSPEQATGGNVDARSDIFSFGSVLYEMVTGRRAFAGNSVTETLGAVVHLEPKPASELAPGVPKDLERLILRCLRKDPSRRVQHIADVKVELLDLQEESNAHPVASVAPHPKTRRSIWLVAGIAGLIAASAGAWTVFMRGSLVAPVRLVAVTTAAGNEVMPSLSPDGDSVAFSWEGESHANEWAQDRDIWITLVGASENRRLTSGPDDDWSPSWSPDGRQIAFVRVPQGQALLPGSIYVVSPLGGPARRIDARTSLFSQLSWSPDSRWIAAPGFRIANDESSKAGGIQLIPLDGGAARTITVPQPIGYDAYPAFSSDGRLAYSSCEKEITPPCDVYVADLGSDFAPKGQARRVTRVRGPIHGIAWAPDEQSIIFTLSTMSVYGTGLGAQLWRVAVNGNEPPTRIDAAPWGSFGPSVNRSRHRLIFGQDRTNMDIFRFESTRPPQPVVASSFVDYAPSFSPDGRRIAYESSRSGVAQEIWVSDPDGSNAVQITRSPPNAGTGAPNWSPDGRRLVFSGRSATGQWDVFTADPDGSARRQLTNDAFVDAVPTWSHDGRWIYYRQDRPDGRDIVRIASEGGIPQRLTKDGVYPMESWDGARLLFTKSGATSPLYSVPAAGGEEQRLIDCVMSRALSVTRPNNLYYLGCTPGAAPVTLHKRDLSTGADEILGMIERGPSNIVLGLAVSPDGKTILYARYTGAGSDLMMLENFR